MGCIYCATNLVNGKIYIGKTVNSLEYRANQHKREVRGNSIFKMAIKKYGFDNFKFESLFESEDESDLYKKERILIKLFDSQNREIGYNLADGGGRNSGWKYSEESRKKLSDSHRGPRPNRRKPIEMYDFKTKELLKTFESTNNAKDELGILRTRINNNLCKRSISVRLEDNKNVYFIYKNNIK